MEQEEHQRVWAVVATFTTANREAIPLSTGQKFQLFFKSAMDPWPFLLAAVLAGTNQAQNSFPAYGQGVRGYAKRFGASYGDYFIGNLLEFHHRIGGGASARPESCAPRCPGSTFRGDVAPAKGTEPRSRSSAGSTSGGQPISTGGRGLTNEEKPRAAGAVKGYAPPNNPSPNTWKRAA